MSYIYLSHNAYPELIEWLKKEGHTPVLIEDNPNIYPAVCAHADLFLCRLGDGASSPLFFAKPAKKGYPECAAICAAANNEYFIHNSKITNPALAKKASEIGLKLIHVNQGFTRCNLLPVGNSFITGDFGINKALISAGLNTLLVSCGHIDLPGHDYGFIGGCAGTVGNTVVFNGDISLHPNYEQILNFISGQGFKVKYFPTKPLLDIGSIIESDTLIDQINP